MLFMGAVNMTSVSIPESITSIKYYAFYGCIGLKAISIPKSVTEIKWYLFNYCSALENISVDAENTVYTSVDGILYTKDMTTIVAVPGAKKKVNIPDGVKTICEGAFYTCKNLTSLTLPESVTSLEPDCFYGCDLQPLKILTKEPLSYNSYTFDGMGSSIIVCHDINYNSIKTLWNGVYSFEMPLIIDIGSVVPYIAGVDFKTVANPYYEGSYTDRSLFVEIPEANITDVPISVGKSNFIDRLKMDTSYSLKLYYNSGEDKVTCHEYSFKTKNPDLYHVDYETTQTTVNIKSLCFDADKSCTPTVYVDNQEYKGGILKLTGLSPSSSIHVKAIYPGQDDSKYLYIRTQDISLSILNSIVYPNAIESECNYVIGDAKLLKVEWVQDNKVISNSERLALTGLAPEQYYYVTFIVTVGYGESGTYSKSRSITVKTKPLELEMQLPKSVGNGKTIVSAKTNLSESEANVGFEWKKTDAPSTLPYSVGYSAIYDGHLEGMIQNLQNAYYNVRAFYKDADGNHYYTDIVSFDPTDFSFFEPTVHTYPAEPEENHATLRGYVLGGTDNILGQGFQYWIVPDGSQHAPRYQAPAADAGVMTVAADGQRMAVVISDLKPGTTYAYRAYAETASGVKYGEEQTFVTPGSAGIEDIAVDEADVTVIGYYDLYGRRYDEPQRGLNIVLYSNGQTRKIIRK